MAHLPPQVGDFLLELPAGSRYFSPQALSKLLSFFPSGARGLRTLFQLDPQGPGVFAPHLFSGGPFLSHSLVGAFFLLAAGLSTPAQLVKDRWQSGLLFPLTAHG